MGDNRADINDVLGRFLKFVSFTDACWLWTGYVSKKSGYGQLRIPANNSSTRAQWVHRVAYELFVGRIPKHLQIDHVCRVRHCVNPDHLEAVTQRENLIRGDGFAGREARQTHCVRGHPLAGANLIINGRGKRECRGCRTLREKSYAQRRKEIREN